MKLPAFTSSRCSTFFSDAHYDQAQTMRRILTLVLLTAAVVAAQGQGQSKGKSNSKGKPANSSTASGTAVAVSVVFSSTDRSTIQQWIHGTPASNLPPGLAKRGDLPPGLQKQLQRNGTLPPGLEKKISPFPADLTRRLGQLPANCGCDRIFLDGRAMIIARATSAILDVISLF